MEERLSAGRDYGNCVLPTQLCREPITALKIKAVHFLKMFDLVSSLPLFFCLGRRGACSFALSLTRSQLTAYDES